MIKLKKLKKKRPIGLFDSGVGGLSVLRELLEWLPKESFIYVGDQKNVPYGKKTLAEIRAFSVAITEYLIGRGVKCIVIPCNTASGAALNYLRNRYPKMLFVGMEPAVKPASEITNTGKVGVLATAGTFKSERYCSLVERFAQGVEVFENPCDGLVESIESGQTESVETKELLQTIIAPMLSAGVDCLVLGCTHYPFVEHLITEVVPERFPVINPAGAVARQTKRILEKANLLLKRGQGHTEYLTTGDAACFKEQISKLLHLDVETQKIIL